MREKEKLLELKKEMTKQKEALKKLEDHMFVPPHPLLYLYAGRRLSTMSGN